MRKRRTKRIDVVEKYFYPVTAGIEVNMLETYSVLVEKGWKVVIHTSRDSLTEKNVFPSHDVVRGIEVRRYPFRWYGFFPKLDWSGRGVVALHNFNVVPHFYIMVYSLLRKFLGLKRYGLALTPHGGFNPEWSVFPRWQAILKGAYHYTVGTLLINWSVDRVRAVSDWEKEEMIGKGVRKDKVVVISNGIEDDAYLDIERFASKEAKRKVKELGKYIIQIGRIYPIKNYETTIKALPYISGDVKYVIVGPIADKRYFERLKKLTRRLGVEDRVVFFGVLRGVDKFYLIKNAKLMVHMALWESFCNVVHEGLSQGLVCIVANNTALPYLIKDGVNGYCLSTRDEDALAKKVNCVLDNENPEELKRIRNKGVVFAREHSWRKVAEGMGELYLLI
jgi:glycosyltransferase involved in cell wall biosynthesis